MMLLCYKVLLAFCCVGFVLATPPTERSPKKRQIYREQVLPHAGGKIPDTAFETDRLFLNRLQKEGIAVPDGIVPEQRSPQVYQYYDKPMRTVYHIALSSDARYIPAEGRYHYSEAPTVETTYLYPQAVGREHVLRPPTHVLPVYRQLQLHNPQLNQVKLQAKQQQQRRPVHYLNIAPAIGSAQEHAQTFRTASFQNVNLFNAPLPSAGPGAQTAYGYGTPHLFNEFDDLFNGFNLHQTPQAYY